MATAKKTTSTKTEPKAATVEPVEAAVKAGQETVETIVKTNTAVAKKGVEKAVAMSEEQFAAAAKAGADAYKGYEDMIAFSKSNIEAIVESNEIFTVGVKEINSSIFKLAQSNMEETVALAQKMMTCTSIAEVVELQSDVAKAQYEKAVAESRKLSDQSLKLAEKAFALKPKHEETGDTLLKLQAEKHDWTSARHTLHAKYKNGHLPRDVHKRRDAVLALGGTAIVPDGALDPDSLTAAQGIGGVIWWGDTNTARQIEQALAKRDGPILPLVRGAPDVARVMGERHLCVDTTAAGGNAALLGGTS